MSEQFDRGTIESRRAEIMHRRFFKQYYEDYWDVKHIADVEEDRDELSETEDRTATQLLECADIDCIIDTYEKQIAVQEKVILSEKGDSLSLRAENKRDGIAPEAQRLMQVTSDPTILTPTVIAVMKMPKRSIDWVRLVSVRRLVEEWQDGDLHPDVWNPRDGVNKKFFFRPYDLDEHGVTLEVWKS